MAFPPARSISLTTDAAASAPFVYVMATFAPSAARRLAIAAPMPREPPVMSAIFPSRFLDIVFSFPSISLFRDPISDVRRAINELDAFRMTSPEEADHVDVHQTHFLQIQHNPRSAVLDLRLQFIQMLRSHSANQPDRCAVPIRCFFDS